MRSGPADELAAVLVDGEHREHAGRPARDGGGRAARRRRRRRCPCRRRRRARRRPARRARAPAASISSDVAVLEHEDRVRRHARARRASRACCDEMAVLAVHRHEVARPHELQHQLQLLLAGVARDVHARRCGLVKTVAPRREMWLITLLIAFSLPGMMRDDRTTVSPGSIFTCAVVAHRDAGQRRHRLALLPGREHVTCRGGSVGELRTSAIRAPAGRAGSRARVRDLELLHHAAADERRPCGRAASRQRRSPAAGDARATRTSRRRSAPARALKIPPGLRRTLRSERREAASLDVGRVARAAAARRARRSSAKRVEVGGCAVDRRLVDLEVAGVDDRAERRA